MSEKKDKHSLQDHKALGPMVGLVSLIFFFVGFLFGFVLFYFIYASDSVQVQFSNSGSEYLTIRKEVDESLEADIEGYSETTDWNEYTYSESSDELMLNFMYSEGWTVDEETLALSYEEEEVAVFEPGLVMLAEDQKCYMGVEVGETLGSEEVVTVETADFGDLKGTIVTLGEEGHQSYCVELDSEWAVVYSVPAELDEAVHEALAELLGTLEIY